MSTPGLPISRLVNVGIVLSPAPAKFPNFNSCLILGTSDVIDVVTRMRAYTSAAAVATAFGESSEEAQAASVWFQQRPQPTSILIGRWAQNASGAQLIGGPVSASNQIIGDWQVINDGAMGLTLNGVPTAFNGLNFAAAANMNGVASVLQTAVAAKVANSTVVWDSVNNRFVITDGTTGVASTISLMSLPRAVGNILFAGNPANNDTVTINGTLVTFKNAAPVGNQVLIGTDLNESIVNLTNFLNSSVDAGIAAGVYTSNPTRLYVQAKATGPSGNAITLAASVATPSGATLVGGSGTAIAGKLNMSASPAYVANGINAETALHAVQVLDNIYGNTWYGLVVPSASDVDHLAIANYIDADTVQHFYGVTTQDNAVLIPNNQTSVAYLLKQQNNDRCMVQYSSMSPYAVVSALARILTTNWGGSNTAITLMYKTEPGITPESLTVDQTNALESVNCNVYVNYTNDVAILENGNTPSGQWVDAIIGADWFATYIQLSVFNTLYTTKTKISQTDAGVNTLATVVESSCDQARLNGLVGPGIWNEAGFGQLNTGDELPNGYYVYAPPIATQNPADRAARKSVPIQVAAKFTGAVHTADIVLNINQ